MVDYLDRIDGILLGIPMWVNLCFYIFFDEKKISSFGSTGSIGLSTLSLIKQKRNFQFIFFSANKSFKKIINK